MIIDALRQGKKLLIFGNGGSAADAQHFAGELVVRFVVNRRALPAIALGCDAVILTACANDFSYEQIFSRQIEALGNAGDIAVGISTSGKSANIVHAIRTARDLGLKTILFSGLKNGEACDLADFTLAAPGANTARVQELHLASYHAICELVDQEFSGVAE
jgi:D-sedoheptulose 7-phosphate isomerase